MPNFNLCIAWCLQFEDPQLSGVVENLNDGAGRTRFGITENYTRIDPSFWVVDKDTALSMAKAYYEVNYWRASSADLLSYDAPAAVLLDASINCGVGTAVLFLQRSAQVVTDGIVGPKTLAAANALDGHDLAVRIRAQQEQYYRNLVVKRPELSRFLRGWLARAATVYPDMEQH